MTSSMVIRTALLSALMASGAALPQVARAQSMRPVVPVIRDLYQTTLTLVQTGASQLGTSNAQEVEGMKALVNLHSAVEQIKAEAEADPGLHARMKASVLVLNMMLKEGLGTLTPLLPQEPEIEGLVAQAAAQVGVIDDQFKAAGGKLRDGIAMMMVLPLMQQTIEQAHALAVRDRNARHNQPDWRPVANDSYYVGDIVNATKNVMAAFAARPMDHRKIDDTMRGLGILWKRTREVLNRQLLAADTRALVKSALDLYEQDFLNAPEDAGVIGGSMGPVEGDDNGVPSEDGEGGVIGSIH